MSHEHDQRDVIRSRLESAMVDMLIAERNGDYRTLLETAATIEREARGLHRHAKRDAQVDRIWRQTKRDMHQMVSDMAAEGDAVASSQRDAIRIAAQETCGAEHDGMRCHLKHGHDPPHVGSGENGADTSWWGDTTISDSGLPAFFDDRKAVELERQGKCPYCGGPVRKRSNEQRETECDDG